MPSLELILGGFEREQDRQLAHFDALDTKAGVVLGFAGVMAALPLEALWLRRLTVLLALAAGAAAMAAFWPRNLPTLETSRLRSYLRAEQRITRLTLVDTYERMLAEGRAVLERKSRRLKVAMAVLVAAGVAAGLAGLTR
jgi:hypothetical protein